MNKYARVPEHVVDLHGYLKSEALLLLKTLIAEKKYSHVRIITGKGTFRESGPVLNDFVKRFLEERNIYFYPAKIRDGGSGAFEVFFRTTQD